MNKVKLCFCLFLFSLSFLHFISVNNINIIAFLTGNGKNLIFESIINKDFENPISFLSFEHDTHKSYDLSKPLQESVVSYKEPLVYIYNTHQKEEYAKSVNGDVPTVVTVSNILRSELEKHGIFSLVENRDIIEETKKRGYDYTGTYTVSFDYLKEVKKNNDSIEYFFDIHRDSVTGNMSRVKIYGKSYATIMFLVGASYDGYEKRLDNINVMKKYLDSKYPGLVRDTYIQKKCSFYQKYSTNMFLIEIGGPDNSLEEVSNSAVALAEAINTYLEVNNEKS